MISAELAASPLVYGVVENRGERLDHLGNPPDMSKYLKKIFACGADFWMVENKGERLEGGKGS